jgi:cell wall-associated NlpC family hydrolase
VKDRELMMKVAWSFLGRPYIWGGDDSHGFDCSGYVIECLQSVGILPRKGDWTAQGLWVKFNANPVPEAYVQQGDLAFWRVVESPESSIIHIEIMVDWKHSIGASGGGSRTITEADAWAQNAYVKVRPIATRAGMAGILDPFK